MLFLNQDLAIGTYRHTVSTMIPDMTRLAWEDKQDDIRKRVPGIERNKFMLPLLTRQEYERAYGTTYKKPGVLSRIMFSLAKLLPKVGPFRPLAFKPLTAEAAQMMDTSFAAARDRYRALLKSIETRKVTVANTDLDTGRPPARIYNPLIEETYAALLDKLADNDFAAVSPALRADLTRHYSAPLTGRALTRKARKLEEKARRQLDTMSAASREPGVR